MRRTLHLSYEEFSLRINGADDGALDWLAEFLQPMFSQHRWLNRPDVYLGLVAADDPDKRLTRPVQSPYSYDGFTCDGHFRQLIGRPTAGRGLKVYDERCDVMYHVARDRERITLEPQGRESRLTRRALMRVVRELATAHQLRQRHLPLHCAAFAEGNGATLLCGPKRSGKTTLLLHALHQRASFISNDRAFVKLGENGAAVRGMPTLIRIRPQSFSFFPDFGARLREARFDSAVTLAESPQPVLQNKPARSISAAQLCQLLDVTPQAAGDIRSLVFPRIDPTVNGLVFHRLTTEQATRALEGSIIRPGTCVRTSEVFCPSAGAERMTATEEYQLRRALASAVPAFGCRIGRHAYVLPPRNCPWHASTRQSAAA